MWVCVRSVVTTITLLISLLISGALSAASDLDFNSSLALLAKGDLNSVDQAIDGLAASQSEHAPELLNQLLAGELYRVKATDQLVTITAKDGSKWTIAPLSFNGEDQASSQSEVVSKRKLKRVGLNNALRGKIKSILALAGLNHPQVESREQAAKQLIGKVTSEMREPITAYLAAEQAPEVTDHLSLALAIFELESYSEQSQTSTINAAIATLSNSHAPQARTALLAFSEANPQNPWQQQIDAALVNFEQRVKVAQFAQTLFFGISLGSVLVLAAIGLAITFGVMGVINMAHGEMMMLGAYTTYVIQTLMPNHITASIFIAIPMAFLVAGLAGVIIERSVIRFLYGRPLETLLATFGISLILQQLVRSVFSPLNRSVATPEFMSGVIEITPLLSLTLNRLYIIGFCLAVFFALFAILRYTRLGIEVRAVSQNRAMARAMGVKSEWVDALTFGLGSGIAGIAGVALSQLTNVGPNLGQAYIIDSFMVVVFGGVGNLWGTLVAGMSLGIANKIMEPWAGAVLAKILVLVFIILFIQKKPRGLFPQKGRSAEG